MQEIVEKKLDRLIDIGFPLHVIKHKSGRLASPEKNLTLYKSIEQIKGLIKDRDIVKEVEIGKVKVESEYQLFSFVNFNHLVEYINRVKKNFEIKIIDLDNSDMVLNSDDIIKYFRKNINKFKN